MSKKQDTIKALLNSLRFSPPGRRWSFLWNPKKPYSFSGGVIFEFYVDFELQTIAAIQAIKCYPEYFTGFSVSTITSLLKKFFESVISEIGADQIFFAQDRNKTVLNYTPASKLPVLVERLDSFVAKNTKKSVYLMPVNGFPCPSTLLRESIAWVPGDYDLYNLISPFGFRKAFIQKGFFPPINDTKIRQHLLTNKDSWFSCHASSESEADSIFKRMVGALSIILKYPQSRFITGRKMINGRVKFSPDKRFTFSEKRSIVPPVGEPIEVNEEMVSDFNNLIVTNVNEYRIQIALEYLSEAWGNTSKLSFINNSIAMDSLFGIEGQVRKSILQGVENFGVAVKDAKEKYDLILKIRNGLLHGEFPNIELCPQYLEFFEKFRCNPADEQIIIINSCILKYSKKSKLIDVKA